MLGTVEVDVDGQSIDVGGPRPLRILTALTIAGRPLSLDELADRAFEDDDRPGDPIPALRMGVRRLRSALGAETVLTRPGGYEIGQVDSDAEHFERLLTACGAEADPVVIQRLAREALDLWRGGPFGELGDLEWLRADRVRLESLRLRAQETWFDAAMQTGSIDEVLPELVAAVEQHPLHDRFQRQVMLAFHRAGRQADALRSFQEYRNELRAAGLEPPEQTRRLDERIGAADPTLLDGDQRHLRGYEIVGRLGEGTFSIVHRATQPSVGREVAIKQIRAELADRAEFIRAFEAEAHIVARLEHPHIVPLIDYWREPGSAYLVMRLLRGGTLEQAMSQHRWSLERAVHMVGEVGGALASAHRAGIVHRDVKPANILLDDDNHAYLSDFGIAIEATTDLDLSFSTGSPSYASPEQLRHEPVGPSADVYGLAITFYETVAGRLPFEEEPTKAALLHRQLHDPVPSLRSGRADIPVEIDAVMQRATAKSPADRYQSVADFVAALEEVITVPAPLRRGSVTAVHDDGRSPYKGLRPFDEADSGDFAGRDRLVRKLTEALGTHRLVAVVGPSGSGKSSVVRAGLVPELRRGGVDGSQKWFVATMLPGARPFEELEASLVQIAAGPSSDLLAVLQDGERGIGRGLRRVLPEGAELLLIIDQFEELFTLCPSEADRRLFLDGVASAVSEHRSRLRVVLTLRADFYDRPLQYRSIGQLVRDATVAVLPLAADELEHAIVDPAAALGGEFAPGLVSQIVADVADQPGALPMLQYALTALWDERVSGMLALDAYRDLGGVSGAIARRAEELHENASGAERAAMRLMFGRLVTVGDGSDDTRRRATLSELGTDAAAAAVVERFGEARLVSFDREPSTREPTVEIAHEALIREWPRLRGWVDEDRDSLRTLRHLNESAAAWDERGRRDEDLYRGSRLVGTEEWAAEGRQPLTDVEAMFLDASIADRDALEEAEQLRAAQRELQNTRLRRLVAAVGTVAALALIAGGVAVQQRSRAAAEARAASEQRTQAETRRLAAAAPSLVDTNRRAALLLAAEGYRREQSPVTLGALQEVLTSTDELIGYFGGGVQYSAVGWSGDGQRIIAGRPGGIDVYEIDAGERRNYEADIAGPIAVDPTSDRVAYTSSSQIHVLDLISGAIVEQHQIDGVVVMLEYSDDGSVLAAGDRSGSLHLFAEATRSSPLRIDAHPEGDFDDVELPGDVLRIAPHEPSSFPAGVRGIAFNSDATLVAATGGVFVRTFDTATGDKVHEQLVDRPVAGFDDRLVGRPEAIDFVAGSETVSVWSGGFLQRWDLDAGHLLSEHEVALSEAARAVVGRSIGSELDGDLAVIAEGDTVTVVDTGSGRALSVPFDGQVQSLQGRIALNPAQDRAVLTGADGLVVWALDGDQLLGPALPLTPESGDGLHASDDGSLVVVNHSAIPRRASLWAVDGSDVEAIDIPADSTRAFLDQFGPVAVQNENAELRVIDPATGAPTIDFGALNNSSAEISPDGTVLAIGRGSVEAAAVRLVDPRTGRQKHAPLDALAEAAGEDGIIYAVTFRPDGDVLVASTANGAAVAFDTTTWEPMAPILSHGGGAIIGASFSPDGRYLATSDGRGVVTLRDPQTFQPTGPPLVGSTSGIRFASSQPLAFTDDGRYLVSTVDGAARIWDIDHRVTVGAPIHSTLGTNITPSRNGAWLTLARGGHIVRYDLRTDLWFDVACRAAGRNLTLDEWRQFGPTDTEPHATCEQWPAPDQGEQ